MSELLGIDIEYDINTEKAKIRTNVKREKVEELLCEYLHGIVGAGKDTTPPEEHPVYTIEMRLDLSDDTWFLKHNCGNKGLREGIIMAVAHHLHENPEKVEWLE